jgi:dUTP pyrophosphatase
MIISIYFYSIFIKNTYINHYINSFKNKVIISFIMSSLAHNIHPTYRVKLCLDNVDNEIVDLYKSKITKLNNTRFSNKHPDSGFDLFVPDTVTIQPGKILLIDMKAKCSVYRYNILKSHPPNIPTPYYMYARSSVSKRGIMLVNSVGIIDCGYRGNLMAAFFNTTDNPVQINKGDRITQVCMRDLSFDFTVELTDTLEETERGSGGIGSTGR